MCDASHSFQIDEAFGAIEETILPSISMLLDTLLDAASSARAGTDAEVHAAELRTIAFQIQHLTAQVEAIAPTSLFVGQLRPLELNISA